MKNNFIQNTSANVPILNNGKLGKWIFTNNGLHLPGMKSRQGILELDQDLCIWRQEAVYIQNEMWGEM